MKASPHTTFSLSMRSLQIRTIFSWLTLGITTTLLYWETLIRLQQEWDANAYYTHGYLMLPLCGWLLWRKRKVLRRVNTQPSWWGLPMLGMGLLLYVAGIRADILFAQALSLIFVLGGVIHTMLGRRMLSETAFPLFILVFMIPLPYLILDPIGFPMKQTAAEISSSILQSFGVPVVPDGVYLHMPNYTLIVEDVCNGLRSLISMTLVSIVFAYIFLSRNSDRLFLILAAIPIALAANIIRILLTAILGYYISDTLATGFLHELSGLFVFVLSIGGLLIVERSLAWRRTHDISRPLSA